MLIYYLFLFFVSVSFLIQEKLGSKKIGVALSTIFMSLIIGLKHFSVGKDTIRYLWKYEHIVDFSVEKSEFGFDAIQLFFKNNGFSFSQYSLILAAFISFVFIFFYYKYSINPFLCIFLHVTIGLFTMSMSGLRQTLSICFGLIGFMSLINRNTIGGLLAFVLSFIIHNSSIILIIPYLFLLLPRFNNLKYGIWVLLLIMIAFIALHSVVFTYFISFAPQRYLSKLDDYGGFHPISYKVVLSWLLLWMVSFVLIIKKYSVLRLDYILFVCFFVSTIHNLCMIMGFDMIHISRLAYYFCPFLIVLIVNTVSSIYDANIRIICYCVLMVLALFQFSVFTPGGTLCIDNYMFYWN